MIKDSKDKLIFQTLEESLWLTNTRFNHKYMGQILHKEFLEFGRSGRIYTRTECINTEPQEIKAIIPLENFTVHFINEHTRLITYISEVRDKLVLRANRSSLWVNELGIWKLRFHQGTPV